MILTRNNTKKTVVVKACTTKVGDLMEIVEPQHSLAGCILLHIHNGFVLLNDPMETWTNSCTLDIIVLKKGESVTLTQE